MSRLAAPWKRCHECGCKFAATICHTCKTPAPVAFTEADLELDAAQAAVGCSASSDGCNAVLQARMV